MMTYNEINAINHSKLRDIDKSLKYYYEKHIAHSIVAQKSKAMIFGSAFHALALQGEEQYAKDVAILLDIDKRSKENKETWDQFYKDSDGKLLIDSEEDLMIKQMHSNLIAKDYWLDLMKDAEIETELYFNYCDVACKGIADIVKHSRNRRTIVDLKTISDINLNTIASYIDKYSYHTQLAFYHKACNYIFGEYDTELILVFCEKNAPYDSVAVRLPNDYIEKASQINEDRLNKYKSALEFDFWPGQEDAIIYLTIPNYLYRG